MSSDVPDKIVVRDGETPPELPPLPEGYVWKVDITADLEVVHPDGSVN